MSSAAGAPLEFSFSVSGGVLRIVPMGATARSVFGAQRDEALLNLMVGEAIVAATTKLKGSPITAIRLAH
jgi:hypothetical protein